jgi:hypothetical protein
MESPPPVYFDLSTALLSPSSPETLLYGFNISSDANLFLLVLDPLVFGVIPESLLPVIGYSCIVALFAWFVVGKIAVHLIRLAIRGGELGEVKASRKKLE